MNRSLKDLERQIENARLSAGSTARVERRIQQLCLAWVNDNAGCDGIPAWAEEQAEQCRIRARSSENQGA